MVFIAHSLNLFKDLQKKIINIREMRTFNSFNKNYNLNKLYFIANQSEINSSPNPIAVRFSW